MKKLNRFCLVALLCFPIAKAQIVAYPMHAATVRGGSSETSDLGEAVSLKIEQVIKLEKPDGKATHLIYAQDKNYFIRYVFAARKVGEDIVPFGKSMEMTSERPGRAVAETISWKKGENNFTLNIDTGRLMKVSKNGTSQIVPTREVALSASTATRISALRRISCGRYFTKVAK